jgi:hypothetical protein
MRLSRIVAFTAALSAGCSVAAGQVFAETVGKAVSIQTTVSGARGALKTADPISRDERIRSNRSGLGQFEFVDGTKLVVGPNSNVVIDEFVLGSGNRFKKLALSATKGTFRWISGKSPSAAYSLATPAGTLGVRGTAVDVALSGNSALMVVLQGRGTWCTRVAGQRQCRTVNRSCDFVVARRGEGISEPQPVSRAALSDAGISDPFLTDDRRLLSSFKAGNCGLGAARIRTERPDSRKTLRTREPSEPQSGSPN